MSEPPEDKVEVIVEHLIFKLLLIQTATVFACGFLTFVIVVDVGINVFPISEDHGAFSGEKSFFDLSQDIVEDARLADKCCLSGSFFYLFIASIALPNFVGERDVGKTSY